MLLVADLVNTKWYNNAGKWLKPWRMGTHLIVLIKSFPMHTNTAGFKRFSYFSAFLCFDESSISIKRFNVLPLTLTQILLHCHRHWHKFQDMPGKQVLKITCPNGNVTFPKINNQNLKKYTDKINRNTILFIHSYGKHFESFLSISIFFLNPFLIFLNHFLIFINDCFYKY